MSEIVIETNGPIIGLGACLVGRPVRYNGVSKRRNQHIDKLEEHVTLRSFCPEVGIGLGVPRETLRLVGDLGHERLMDSSTQSVDHSHAISAYAAGVASSNCDLSGYILVKGSPSCGFERVKRYSAKGNVVLSDAVGIFAAEMQQLDPLLPMEEDGRLHDAGLRENFVLRVYTYHDWKRFVQAPLSHHRLTQFWSRYKYLMMSQHVPSYRQIGRLLGDSKNRPVQEAAAELIKLLMSGLAHRATRKTHTNVLQHIRGYLKRDLDSTEKREMDALIMQYRSGQIPLVVPLTLMRHHFRRHGSEYIEKQVYMQPYPEQLSLRNLI